MVTENKDAAVVVAAILYARIEEAARQPSSPSELRDLAEAFALVSRADPKKEKRATTY